MATTTLADLKGPSYAGNAERIVALRDIITFSDKIKQFNSTNHLSVSTESPLTILQLKGYLRVAQHYNMHNKTRQCVSTLDAADKYLRRVHHISKEPEIKDVLIPRLSMSLGSIISSLWKSQAPEARGKQDLPDGVVARG
jgi:hypothetical protein